LIKVALRRGGRKSGGRVGEELWGLLGFVSFMCVWVYFYCCCEGCLCQGLQGASVVYNWYSRLVAGGDYIAGGGKVEKVRIGKRE
jgi:hypothetical protein